MQIIRRFLILGLFGLLCALADGLLTGLPDLSQPADAWGITLGLAQGMEQLIWVDGRDHQAYEASHLPGAIHLDFEDWDGGLSQVLGNWEPGMQIVVYCEGDGCESSRAIAEKLRSELEMEEIYWLTGGWASLREGTGPK